MTWLAFANLEVTGAALPFLAFMLLEMAGLTALIVGFIFARRIKQVSLD
jgi:hypothetical protein